MEIFLAGFLQTIAEPDWKHHADLENGFIGLLIGQEFAIQIYATGNLDLQGDLLGTYQRHECQPIFSLPYREWLND